MLASAVAESLYEFKILLYGLNVAPKVFTMIPIYKIDSYGGSCCHVPGRLAPLKQVTVGMLKDL